MNVLLAGDAATVGDVFGRTNAADIRDHCATFFTELGERGLSELEVLAKRGPFVGFCERFAPHWLAEAAAVAAAADLPADHYVAFLAGKARALFLLDECTSFLAVGDATADGASLFHKTRDNVARPQCCYHKRIEAPGVAAYWATGDTSDLGVMMMVNEHGVAGSADMGGLPVGRPRGRGVMNPHILRLIAERAERCEDALAIVQECLRDGWYAGGAETGTLWLFADRHGTGLRIAQNNETEEHLFVHDTILFSARGETAGARRVTSRRGRVTPADLNAAAHDPNLCFASSISAMTVRIDPDRPPSSTVWFALPAWAPYVPLPAGPTPRPLLDGGYYRVGAAALTAEGGFGQGAALSATYLVERDERQAQIDGLVAQRPHDLALARLCCEIGMGAA